jgi:hypothetical protein
MPGASARCRSWRPRATWLGWSFCFPIEPAGMAIWTRRRRAWPGWALRCSRSTCPRISPNSARAMIATVTTSSPRWRKPASACNASSGSIITCRRSWPARAWARRSPTQRSPRRPPSPSPAQRATASRPSSTPGCRCARARPRLPPVGGSRTHPRPSCQAGGGSRSCRRERPKPNGSWPTSPRPSWSRSRRALDLTNAWRRSSRSRSTSGMRAHRSKGCRWSSSRPASRAI